MMPLALGIDLGTSGVRIAVSTEVGDHVHTEETGYRHGLVDPADWLHCCTTLIRAIPDSLRLRINALAIDGTSGTLLACDAGGEPLGAALPYNLAFPEHCQRLSALVPEGGPAASTSGSLARALVLIERHGDHVLLRHQADWVSGWLLQSWTWGEEGNNLRLGWSLQARRWTDAVAQEPWADALPRICASGQVMGRIDAGIAQQLGLREGVFIVAGTTDSNAAVLAADPGDGEGITVLGSTLVIKCFHKAPLHGPGITNHRVGERWLCGGASNAGGAVLLQHFPGVDLAELSRQIDPDQSSGLDYWPLAGVGERFAIDDPLLAPRITPRPVSDALFLQGLLEGMARIEAQGWQRLTELGAKRPHRLITLGGGARNPQWRRIRERIVGCQITSCLTPPAAGVARLAVPHLHH